MKRLDITQIQKDQARKLRAHGMSQARTAALTGLTKGIVNNLTRNDSAVEEDRSLASRMDEGKACLFCGETLDKAAGPGRPRRFCCETCRRDYWKIHRHDHVGRSAVHHIQVCAWCGKTFEVYENVHRKYCCHEHYLLHRNTRNSDVHNNTNELLA